jgi:hypothetical protein
LIRVLHQPVRLRNFLPLLTSINGACVDILRAVRREMMNGEPRQTSGGDAAEHTTEKAGAMAPAFFSRVDRVI